MTPAAYQERLVVARSTVAFRDELRARTPPWIRDQVDAGGREQHRNVADVGMLLPLIAPDRGWYQTSATDLEDFGLDRAARLYAASMGCAPCIHLRRNGAQPAWAQLNHRIVTCRRCAATWRTPIDDERCEVCDEQAGPTFTPFLIQLGLVAIGGNAGDCCAQVVIGDVAA
jgi:hypothetical protein